MENSRRLFIWTFPVLASLAAAWTSSCDDDSGGASNSFDQAIVAHKNDLFEEGRRIFRFDTFGDEAWWGDQLRLHEAILGADLGGVGPGVSPETALAVGLKVDLDALPPELVEALQKGLVDLTAPATTVALLQLNAVVGVTGCPTGGTGRRRSKASGRT